jgi:ATP-binding cassette subfamily B protein
VKLRLENSFTPLVEILRESLRFVRLIRRFREYLRPQIGKIVTATLASVAYTAATLLEPWPLQIIFDGVLLGDAVSFLGIDLTQLAREQPLMLLGAASVAVLLLAAARGQFYYEQNVRTATAGQAVVMSIRRLLFRHLQTLPLSFHRNARGGDLLMRLTGDIVMLREMVVAALVTLLTQGLVIVGILAIMGTLNLRLTLVGLLVVPLLFVVLSVFRLRLVNAATRQRKREGRLAASMHQVLGAIEIVQANTAERFEDQRFKEMNKRSLRAGVRLTRIEGQMNRAVQVSIALGVCITLWWGSQDVMAGRLSPGQLLVFLAYLRGLYRPLRQIAKLTQRMAKASACTDRVIEILDTEATIGDVADPVIMRNAQGRISFRGVTFGYEPGISTLKDIDLEIAAGEMVALVGPTGAGKTSLLALIPRFFDPQAGEVLFDDIPVNRIRLRSLRRQVSYLPQEAVVMGVSVAENIAYGALGRKGPPPDRAEIEQMARSARAHEFIVRLPRGYDTVVGERGATLSGGQRQRIAIARTLMRRSVVVLLDEPMTGLDPLSEAAVLEAVEAVTKDRTTVVVAHHMKTVLSADRIVFLEDGQIVEIGRHRDLLSHGGRYTEFYQREWGDLARRA